MASHLLHSSNLVLCFVWSYNFYAIMLHHWITATSYDRKPYSIQIKFFPFRVVTLVHRKTNPESKKLSPKSEWRKNLSSWSNPVKQIRVGRVQMSKPVIAYIYRHLISCSHQPYWVKSTQILYMLTSHTAVQSTFCWQIKYFCLKSLWHAYRGKNESLSQKE